MIEGLEDRQRGEVNMADAIGSLLNIYFQNLFS